MKCQKCGIEVPSSYVKCPSCGFGFHGLQSPSSFELNEKNTAVIDPANLTPIQQQTNQFSTTTASKEQFSKFATRLLAYFIDFCIVLIPAIIIGALVGIWGIAWDESDKITTLKAQGIAFFIAILYEAIFLSGPWMATPGKRLMGIKVVDINSAPINFWRAMGRTLSKVFISSIFLIGFIMAAFTSKKQALHDLMANTIVIKDK
jgi:uncharacterized RDD family membrane protein YckC